MSLAKLIHKNKTKEVATATVAIPAISSDETSPTVAKIARIAVANPTNEKIKRDIEKIRSWLYRIGEPEEDHYLVLNKCRNDPEALAYYLERIEEIKRQERRTQVLAILADKPDIQRAFVTNTEADSDNVMLTMAIRSRYTFEMLIPKSKYDPFTLLELINKGVLQ